MIERLRLVLGLSAMGWLAFSVPTLALAADSAPSAAFNPTISLSVTSGTPGTLVTVRGTGFPPGEIVALYIDSPVPYVGNHPPGPVSDQQGSIVDTFKWPDQNYDATHRVDPSLAGPHQVCGDTGYPGGSQPVAAKACAEFHAVALPSPSPTLQPAPGQPASLPELLAGSAILIAIVVVTFLWMRRAR
jgi:hypothetical protein